MDRARVWTSFVAVAAGLASATAIITVAAREANEPIAPLVFGYLVVANTFLIGIVLMAIGLVALYIGTIHTEVINRPLYVVRERLNFDEKIGESVPALVVEV